jgi:hypothetical protein
MTMCYFEKQGYVTSRQKIAARLPAFVYLKRAGKLQLWLAASGQ